METQQLVTIIPWTFIAQILNLFIQMYLIKKFLFKPVMEILEKRKKKTDEEIQSAREARAEAEDMKEKYEADMADARAEASRIVQSAQKEADARAEEVLSQAREEASAMKNKAEADIAQERRKAINEVKDEIGGIAMDIAGKVVEREISEEDHKKLIDEFIENVGEAS